VLGDAPDAAGTIDLLEIFVALGIVYQQSPTTDLILAHLNSKEMNLAHM
jgi:hypothetical protein